MPRVPTIDSFGNLAPAGSPRARQTNPVTPAGLAPNVQQLQQVATGLSQLSRIEAARLQRLQDREDADAVFRAETSLREAYLEHAQRVKRERQGVHAKGTVDDFESWFAETRSEREGELTNNEQRLLFERAAQRVYLQGKNDMGAWEDTQTERAMVESWQASKVSNIRMAIANPSPENIALTTEQLRKQNVFMASQQGWSIEKLEAANAKDLTTMHTEVLSGLADTDPESARAYFEKHKGEIAAEEHDTLQKLVTNAVQLEQTQANADEIMGMGLSHADAMAYVEKNFKGDDEQDLKRELINRYTEKKAAIAEGRQKAYEAGLLLAVRGQNVPASLFAKMDDGQKTQVIQAQRAEAVRRQKEADGVEISTDWKLYTRLRQMPDAELAKLSLEPYLDKLNPKEVEILLDRRDAVRKDTTKTIGVAAWNRQVTQFTSLLGLDGENKAKFEQVADRALYDFEKSAKRDATEEERVKLLDRLVLEGEVNPGWGPDPNVRYYEIYGAKDAAGFVPFVPDEEREKIEDALKRAGRTVDDETVVELYRRKMGL